MKTFYLHVNNHVNNTPARLLKIKRRCACKDSFKRSFTVAGTFDEEKNVINFGLSVCSAKDQFNKKIGRVKSLGHALAKNSISMDYEGDKSKVGNFFRQNALEIISHY